MHKLKVYIILFIWGLLLQNPICARPANSGIRTVSQPDGSSFTLISYGDEFFHISKTQDGYAVVRDLDGWWCYATEGENGKRTSSGWHVGKKTPSEILTTSRAICQMTPETLNRIKTARSLQNHDSPILGRIKTAHGTKTPIIHKHGIVLLAAFKDVSFQHTRNDFEAMLTQIGYNRGGATGCAKEYFESQFGSSYKFDFDVSDILTLSKNRAEYGANAKHGQDIAPEEMVIEACKLAAQLGIDFSKYDQDNDGEVDNVFVFFAGDDEAEYQDDLAHDECIWSHAWFIWDGAQKRLELNGKLINRYACTAEMSRISNTRTLSGIGTFCHEYTHTLGLPDYYDTDYERSGGMSASMWGRTALMDSGNQNNRGNTPPYFNAIDREFLGIDEPVRITSDGTYTMTPIGEGGKYYRIDTDCKDEYYLLECRTNEGWDKYIGGKGMLIYHIDKSDRIAGYSDIYSLDMTAKDKWNIYNEVNSIPTHQCADLVEADCRNDKFQSFDAFGNSMQIINGIFFPRNGVTSFTPTSKPAMKFWSGDIPDISILNIKQNDKEISFEIKGFSNKLPKTSIDQNLLFQDAAIISFSSDIALTDAVAEVAFGETGQAKEIVKIKPYAPGLYSITLENLKPSTNYEATIAIITEKGRGKTTSTAFLTGRLRPDGHPHISFKEVKRNPDFSFPVGCKLPLRMCNATAAAEIQWFFDEKPVKVGNDGFFSPKMSGKLKGVVMWEDGSQDIVVKELKIKNM